MVQTNMRDLFMCCANDSYCIKLYSLLAGRENLCAELFEDSFISVSSVFSICVICLSFHRS